MKKITLLVAILFLTALGCNKTAQQPTTALKPAPQTPLTTDLPPKQTPPSPDEDKPTPVKKTFISKTLGLTFTYNAKPAVQANIVATEVGNKVYVHDKDEAPEQGQSVEVFDKDPSVSLANAITERFLKGIPSSECKVEVAEYKLPLDAQVSASITYPDPNPDNDIPDFAEPNRCTNYSRTNGIQYFFMNTNYPDRYYFLRIGQYSMTDMGTGTNDNWSSSIQIIDRN
jgi:hypothetical protein